MGFSLSKEGIKPAYTSNNGNKNNTHTFQAAALDMLLTDYCNAMLHVYTRTVFRTEITPIVGTLHG
jgi:hypothetical protein